MGALEACGSLEACNSSGGVLHLWRRVTALEACGQPWRRVTALEACISSGDVLQLWGV